MTPRPHTQRDREADIIDAALFVLARDGIGGVSMRAVARQANVALGLANYYFADKTSLISAVLRRVGEQDLAIVDADPESAPDVRLRNALERVTDPEFMRSDYLSLRLQLWSLATVDATYAEINRIAQQRYLHRLTQLIAAAVPGLDDEHAARRAGEILVIQNGVWLTAAVIDVSEALRYAIERCHEIGFAPAPPAHLTRRRR